MRVFWFTAGLVLCAPVQAQQAPGQPDNAALLKAIQQLQREVKDLKAQQGGNPAPAGASSAPAATGVAPPAPVASPALPKTSVPGWAVKLVPWTEDGSGRSVGWFPGPMADFTFDLHSRVMPGQNRFVYDAIGFYRLPEAGTYTFSMFLEPVMGPTNNEQFSPSTFNCTTEFYVDDNQLFAGGTSFGTPYPPPNKDIYRSQSFYGSVALQKQDHKLEAKVDCALENDKSATYFDRALANWKKNRFKILVKAPGDAIPRAFGQHELFYVGQPD